jgi:hypothetical protein
MILPAAKILEESLMAVEFPQGVSRAAFRKSLEKPLASSESLDGARTSPAGAGIKAAVLMGSSPTDWC